MPISPAIIGAGAEILGGVTQTIASAIQNKKNKQWQAERYDIERKDSLADWTRQNEYNSPTSQMARLRQAGLNPNLVYGKGADNTATAVRSTNTGQPHQEPIRTPDMGRAVGTYFDVQMRTQQLDNLKLQNTVLAQESVLKALQADNLQVGIDTNRFNLGMKQDLKMNSLQTAQEALRRLQTGTDVQLQRNEREKAMMGSSIALQAEQILRSKAERGLLPLRGRELEARIANMKADKRLKDLDASLKEKGIQPGDNLFFRVLGRVVDQFGYPDIEGAFKNKPGRTWWGAKKDDPWGVKGYKWR